MTDPRVAELEFLAFLDEQEGSVAVSSEMPDRLGITPARLGDMVFHLIFENCADGKDRPPSAYIDASVSDVRTQMWRASALTVGRARMREFPYSLQITHAGRLRLSRLREELDRARISDQTGILVDGRHFERDLRVRFAVAGRGVPVAVMVADLDHFKKVNDTLGHPRGDDALRVYFTLLRDIVSAYHGDAYRKGGDETIAILPERDMSQAEQIAEKLRLAIETEFRTFDEKLESPPTASIGVASFLEQTSSDEVFEKVDRLLYRAKNGGRNRVVSA